MSYSDQEAAKDREITALRSKLAKADALAKACVFYKGIRWTPSVPPDLWMQVERALEAYESEAAPTPAATVSAEELLQWIRDKAAFYDVQDWRNAADELELRINQYNGEKRQATRAK